MSALSIIRQVCISSNGRLSEQLVQIDTNRKMLPGFSAVHWGKNGNVMSGFIQYKDAWAVVKDSFFAHVVVYWNDNNKPVPIASGYSWEEVLKEMIHKGFVP